MKIIVVSDLQCGSTYGLCPEEVSLLEGGKYRQNRIQRWLWVRWLDFCKWSKAQGEKVIVINGDWVQGIHPQRDISIISPSREVQKNVALDTIEPLLDDPKIVGVFVTRGTEFHDGPSGEDIEGLAKEIGAKRNELGKYSSWALWFQLEGKLIHFTHHIGMAPVYPTTPPASQWRLVKQMFADKGQSVPDVMVRSHIHRWGVFPDTSDGPLRFMFTMPGWQVVTPYVYKRNPLSLPDIGGMALWVEDDQIRFQDRRYAFPQPRQVDLEKLQMKLAQKKSTKKRKR